MARRKFESCSKYSTNLSLVIDPQIFAAKTSPKVVIEVIKEVEFENQRFIRLASFPFSDQLRVVFVDLENIVSSMFIKAS